MGSQHEVAWCKDGDLDTALRQLKADGRRILDFWRLNSKLWLVKVMKERDAV